MTLFHAGKDRIGESLALRWAFALYGPPESWHICYSLPLRMYHLLTGMLVLQVCQQITLKEDLPQMIFSDRYDISCGGYYIARYGLRYLPDILAGMSARSCHEAHFGTDSIYILYFQAHRRFVEKSLQNHLTSITPPSGKDTLPKTGGWIPAPPSLSMWPGRTFVKVCPSLQAGRWLRWVLPCRCTLLVPWWMTMQWVLSSVKISLFNQISY